MQSNEAVLPDRAAVRLRWSELRGQVRPAVRWAAVITLAGLVALLATSRAPVADLGGLYALSVVLTGPQGSLAPGTHEPLLMAYARAYPVLVVAVIAALGAALSECVNYLLFAAALGSRRLERMRSSRWLARVQRAFGRQPFLTVVVCSFAPVVPFWLARIASTTSAYSPRRHVLAYTLGRVPRYALLASLGVVLPVSDASLLTFAAVAAGLALLAAAWRFGRRSLAVG